MSDDRIRRRERPEAHAVQSVEAAALGSRHPFQIFTLGLCLFIGIPLLLGVVQPGSISELLSPLARLVWGLGLVVGAGVALGSTYMRNHAVGVILEQLGLVLVGSSTLFYGAAVLLTVGFRSGIVAIIFMLGFGLSCFWRWVQLQRLLNAASTSAKADDRQTDRESR